MVLYDLQDLGLVHTILCLSVFTMISQYYALSSGIVKNGWYVHSKSSQNGLCLVIQSACDSSLTTISELLHQLCISDGGTDGIGVRTLVTDDKSSIGLTLV